MYIYIYLLNVYYRTIVFLEICLKLCSRRITQIDKKPFFLIRPMVTSYCHFHVLPYSWPELYLGTDCYLWTDIEKAYVGVPIVLLFAPSLAFHFFSTECYLE